MDKFIGLKKIKQVSGEIEIMVEYEDGSKEIFSKLMYDKIVSDISCDATTLREKRILPIVQAVLGVLRDWGIKLNELPYMSAVLNQSLKQNEDEALKELWLTWIPTLNTIEDIDLVAIDSVLKSKGKREEAEKKNPVISPFLKQ